MRSLKSQAVMKTPNSQYDLLQSLVKSQQDEGRNEL